MENDSVFMDRKNCYYTDVLHSTKSNLYQHNLYQNSNRNRKKTILKCVWNHKSQIAKKDVEKEEQSRRHCTF